MLDPYKCLLSLQGASTKKNFWYCPLGGGGQKNFLCTFNDQFKQFFFVGGVIYIEKIKKKLDYVTEEEVRLVKTWKFH